MYAAARRAHTFRARSYLQQAKTARACIYGLRTVTRSMPPGNDYTSLRERAQPHLRHPPLSSTRLSIAPPIVVMCALATATSLELQSTGTASSASPWTYSTGTASSGWTYSSGTASSAFSLDLPPFSSARSRVACAVHSSLGVR